MIEFKEHSSKQYPPRTFENAIADVTIAFAFDFNTPGERLTKEAVRTQGKKYAPIDMNTLLSGQYGHLRYMATIDKLNNSNASTINIAGNQLATCLKFGVDQSLCDLLIFNFLKHIFSINELRKPITLIRSGGQSGFDEAGLKAAVKLGIPALCLCPKGWRFNDINGTSLFDEQKFKDRFKDLLIL